MSPTTIARALADSAAGRSIPGFVAAAIKDGDLIHQSAHGLRAPGGAAMTMDTVFRIYSLTKPITSLAVLQLVERGEVDLDASASRYAPEMSGVRVLTGFDADGAPILRPPGRAPTVRNLLMHTSGFGYTLWNADLMRYAAWAARAGFNPLLDLPLVFDPGEAWEYGIGVDWAGRIVENVSGQTLDRYFESNIFGPLEMRATGFAPNASMSARSAMGCTRGADGRLVPSPSVAVATFLSGGGGLFSTAPDYLKFLSVFTGGVRHDRPHILDPELIELMAQCDDSSPGPRALKTASPLVNDLDLWRGAEVRFGLGFLINTKAGPYGRSAASLSWAGRGNAYFWIDRAKRLAAVLMTQLSPFPDHEVLAVVNAFERALYR